jgi:ADP-ribosylglycohydrolase/predicted enzyme related to lactoylglutathione lyase
MTDLSTRATAAFLGAAVGDALGWPQENRSSNVDRKAPQPSMAFRAWMRRSGGRFNPYEEPVAAGAYSDDTQMICAVARSLLQGRTWNDWLTAVEMPSFRLYQRGAGRALLAGCRAWSAGVPPWREHKTTNPNAYFEAGGNGGAMRILPHVVTAVGAGRQLEVCVLFRDVVASHGHPRASVGAALHAAALHMSLSMGGTLGYGELIQALLDDSSQWATVPDHESMPDGWLASWKSSVPIAFEDSWRATVNEVRSLLLIAQKGMGSGALASEQDTLKELGCTAVKTVGSGTASSVGAIYLASRSAANPKSGLLAAAYLPKADTDTLASMTTSLLAALTGPDWMMPLDSQVQDAQYIADLCKRLLHVGKDSKQAHQTTESNANHFLSSMEKSEPGSVLSFLDGRSVTLDAREALRSKSESTDVEAFRLRSDDGQTLQIVRTHKKVAGRMKSSSQTSFPLHEARASDRDASALAIGRIGVQVAVSQLDVMRSFYEGIIGMTPTRIGTDFVTLNDVLALSASESLETQGQSRIVIYINVTNIDELWLRVKREGIIVVGKLSGERGRRRFRCFDPETNVLEVRETS